MSPYSGDDIPSERGRRAPRKPHPHIVPEEQLRNENISLSLHI